MLRTIPYSVPRVIKSQVTFCSTKVFVQGWGLSNTSNFVGLVWVIMGWFIINGTRQVKLKWT